MSGFGRERASRVVRGALAGTGNTAAAPPRPIPALLAWLGLSKRVLPAQKVGARLWRGSDSYWPGDVGIVRHTDSLGELEGFTRSSHQFCVMWSRRPRQHRRG